MIFVTGAAGFIGSNFVHYLKSQGYDDIVVIDKLTYAASTDNLSPLTFPIEIVDIANKDQLEGAFRKYRPRFIFHFAAESHVDNSIEDATPFLDTNVRGTLNLLELSVKYDIERFHHISTDEVYGALGYDDPPFTEETPYNPQNPYSASKAASDHFVTAFGNTHGLPVVCLLYTSPSPRDRQKSRMPSSA